MMLQSNDAPTKMFHDISIILSCEYYFDYLMIIKMK